MTHVHSYDPVDQFAALQSAYHPDYGLPTSTRLEAVRLVVHWLVSVEETARLCNVSTTTVYKWLKAAGQPAPRFAASLGYAPAPLVIRKDL